MSSRDSKNLLHSNPSGAISIVSSSSRGPTSNETERAPFLPQEPVRLTPSWEENNLPNDELNFKGLTMERAQMELHPPHDRYKLVFMTLIIHGVGTLMPWNMFITAKSYFVDYKLSQNYTGTAVTGTTANSTDTGTDLMYGSYFLAYIGFAAQVPNLIFNWLNIFVNLGGNLTKRIVWSILIEIVVFVVTVGLAMVDSSSWPGTFFVVTVASVVILNMASGIYQNSVYGMVAKLPFKYTGAVVLGSNISGTFTSVISILSYKFASSERTAAIYYFITAMFVLLVCFDTYFALPLNKFYRYHEMLKEKEAERNRKAGRSANSRPPYWTIFKQAFPQLFNVFFTFFITLLIFPTIHSDIRPVSDDFIVPADLYVSVMCFLTFNFFAMLGSLTTSWITWPKPEHLVFPVLLRMVFVPLFLFCNYLPKNIDRVLPVLINSDWAYWVIAVLMAFSSGYLSSLGMMYVPQSVDPRYSGTAGMFGAAMLITGIFLGITFSPFFSLLVRNNFLEWFY